MLKRTNIQAGDVEQSLIVFSSLGFSPSLTQAPFLQAVILNPVEGYAYNVLTSSTPQTATVRVQWAWIGTGDNPLTGGNFDIGLRVEPFVLST